MGETRVQDQNGVTKRSNMVKRKKQICTAAVPGRGGKKWTRLAERTEDWSVLQD